MTEYMLCSKFGWTLTELYDQPANKVSRFIQIMRLEGQTNATGAQEQ